MGFEVIKGLVKLGHIHMKASAFPIRYFVPHSKKKISRNICIHTKPLKPTENSVVYMPDQYGAL